MWTEWNGQNDDGPYLDDSPVDIKFRDGDIYYEQSPDLLWWDHTGEGDDIIAWRYSD